MPLLPTLRRAAGALFRREIVPDPAGLSGFLLVGALLVSHLLLPAAPRGYLFSGRVVLEILGHVWLLLGPPLALYLGLRHLVVRGDSLLPLLTVPFALLLVVVTGVGVTLGLVAG